MPVRPTGAITTGIFAGFGAILGLHRLENSLLIVLLHILDDRDGIVGIEFGGEFGDLLWREEVDQLALALLGSSPRRSRLLEAARAAAERTEPGRPSEPIDVEACAAPLLATAGRRIEAAQLLGIGRNTITRKIQELGLE